MAIHIAQLEVILSNQVKETQYLRRMIENFHFADRRGMCNQVGSNLFAFQ